MFGLHSFLNPDFFIVKVQYTSSHVDNMTEVLAANHVVHPVTFPVHAGIASNSLEVLKSLIHSSVDGTSLTLWCGPGDWVDYHKLNHLVNSIGKDKVYAPATYLPVHNLICCDCHL